MNVVDTYQEISPAADVPAFEILPAVDSLSPLVVASPHSGRIYPDDLLAATGLSFETLRRTEDSFVDELVGSAPRWGAPLLRALYARVYLDVNREPFELDPAMFADDLPPHINTTSFRVAGGLGTIARVVGDGAEVYRQKLRYADAEVRVRDIYYPYHHALRELLDAARARHGFCVLLDCHSMPSSAGTGECAERAGRPDFVLGDRFSTTCAPVVGNLVESVLTQRGYRVGRNNPYAGGYTTYNYGRPSRTVHALQIEINRRLYMDEDRYRRTRRFGRIAEAMADVIGALSRLDRTALSHE